jgi:hypothetical protein
MRRLDQIERWSGGAVERDDLAVEDRGSAAEGFDQAVYDLGEAAGEVCRVATDSSAAPSTRAGVRMPSHFASKT